MKKHKKQRVKKPDNFSKEPVKTLMMVEGKFLHGTRGKPTNGPRGNKKY